MVIVHHLRKRASYETERVTLDRIRGSSTIIQFCRSVWGVWKPDAEVAGIRVDCLKNAFVMPPDAFGFSVVEGVIRYEPPPDTPHTETTVDKAAEYLRASLRAEPRRFTVLLEDAVPLGISRNSLYRARDKMGIVAFKGTWSLPTSLTDDAPYPF